jgi:hypothetical protein
LYHLFSFQYDNEVTLEGTYTRCFIGRAEDDAFGRSGSLVRRALLRFCVCALSSLCTSGNEPKLLIIVFQANGGDAIGLILSHGGTI